jgi:hypothetical protein
MDRHVFRELLSAGYGLVPGRLPGSVEYLGREIFMAVSSRSFWKERRKNLYGVNDSVCSGSSNFINDRRSGVKPWSCRKHCVILV